MIVNREDSAAGSRGSTSADDGAPTERQASGASAGSESVAPPSDYDQRKSLLDAVGGGRGALETSLPGLVFVTAFALGVELKVAAIVAAVLGLLFFAVRLMRKETVQYAIGGFIGALIAGLFAISTGNPTDYFVPSLLKNLGFGVLYAGSVLVRWPLLGVLLGPLLKENFAWRHDDARRRAYARVTWIWAGMFALRLAVMLPLYLFDLAFLLGVATVTLGWPVFAVVAWASWMVLKRVPPTLPAAR